MTTAKWWRAARILSEIGVVVENKKLLELLAAHGAIAKHFQVGLWASAVYPDAKTPGLEAGMQSALNTIPAIIAGFLGIECFGILSGAEMNSPVQLVIDNNCNELF